MKHKRMGRPPLPLAERMQACGFTLTRDSKRRVVVRAKREGKTFSQFVHDLVLQELARD